jgi:hypothetical protein
MHKLELNQLTKMLALKENRHSKITENYLETFVYLIITETFYRHQDMYKYIYIWEASSTKT